MRIFLGFAVAAACWSGLAHAEAAPGPAPRAPVAANATLEQRVLAEINYVRAHPRDYADELRHYRSLFRGRLVYEPGDSIPLATNEGTSAVDEAIAWLDRQAPLAPLAPGSVLAAAALDHARAQGPRGLTGHVSTDGASPGDRVRRRGGDIYVGETISYGYDRPDQVVRAFIVDDGVPDRGHRELIFDPEFHFAGVGCGMHARFRYLCVVDYAGTVNGAPDFASPIRQRPAAPSRARTRRATYQGIASNSDDYDDAPDLTPEPGETIVYEEVVEEIG